MGLFGKKKQIRFESILVDQETDVFSKLEQRGWILCTDPFQFDINKSHEKLRKDAMNMAKDLHAELLVEVWDPIFQRMHWRGLKYAAWRRATPAEMMERQKKEEMKKRPDYHDSMGDYERIHQQIDKKKLQVAQEDIAAFAKDVDQQDIKTEGEVYGSSEEDMGMRSEHLEVYKAYDPYDHQGESDEGLRKKQHIDSEAADKGPMFDSSMKLETGDPSSEDPTKEIDPLALMMEAAGTEEIPAQPPAAQQTPPPQPQQQPQQYQAPLQQPQQQPQQYQAPPQQPQQQPQQYQAPPQQPQQQYQAPPQQPQQQYLAPPPQQQQTQQRPPAEENDQGQ
ncbi:MAG: hypothetical protein ACMUIE_05200 [Thermoplasmatota archaeon]